MTLPMPSVSRRARRYLAGVVLIGLVLALIIVRQLLASEHPDIIQPLGADFLNVWGAPQIARHDLTALFDVVRYMEALHQLLPGPLAGHNWSYPLSTLWLYAPFSLLPYLPALALWSALGLAAYLAATRSLAAGLPAFALMGLALSPAVLVNFYSGQNGLWLGALALAALGWLGPRPLLAGICIGLLSVKPHLGLVWPVALLALGAWRTLAAATATTLLLYGASFLIHGIEAWRAYLAVMPSFQLNLASQSLPGEGGFLTHQLMMLSPFPTARLAGIPLPLAVVAQLAVSLGVLALLWRRLPHITDPAERAILLGSALLLATPYAFNYDATLLTAGLVMRWIASPPVRVADRYRDGIAFLAPLLTYKCNMVLAPFLPLVLLWLFLATARHAPTGGDAR